MKRILTIARSEYATAARSRWTGTLAWTLFLLGTGLSYFSLFGAGAAGFQGFQRTTVALLNLSLALLPLLGLALGTGGFSGERGYWELVLSQPVARWELAAGKFLGLAGVLVTAGLFGYGGAGVVIALLAGPEAWGRYLALVALSLVLGAAFIALAAALSAAAALRPGVLGSAVVAWFFFVLLYDLLVAGLIVLSQGAPQKGALVAMLLANPVDTTRVLALTGLGAQTLAGATGAALGEVLAGPAGRLALATGLGLWLVLPLAWAAWRMGKLDV